jgi:hypothetical protein
VTTFEPPLLPLLGAVTGVFETGALMPPLGARRLGVKETEAGVSRVNTHVLPTRERESERVVFPSW